MTEPPTPNKLAKWIRPLIGGLLSAVIAMGGLSVAGPFLGAGFYTIPFFILHSILSKTMGQSWATQVVLIVFLFWFPVGVVLAHFIKDNRKAILSWFLLCVIFYVIGFPLLIFMWGNG